MIEIIVWAVIGTAIGLLFGLVKILFERVNERPEEWEVRRLIEQAVREPRSAETAFLKQLGEHGERLYDLSNEITRLKCDVYKLNSNIRYEKDKDEFLKEHSGEPLTEDLFDWIRRL